MAKLPFTSLKANEQAKELKEAHNKRILEAMEGLDKANYEKIAASAGLEKHQVGRRLIDLERDQKVFKPGTTSKTSSGREAYDYKLCTFSDHAKNLIGIPQKLFGE
jgi:hypothetical protein